VPGSFVTIYAVTLLPTKSPELTHVVTVAIGVALVLAALGLLFGQARQAENKVTDAEPPKISRAKPRLTVFLGLFLGVVVSLTSLVQE
jgi:hypothetical protein